MRILVCGSRDYTNRIKLWQTLDEILARFSDLLTTPDLLLIQGGAKGADDLAKEWANERGINQHEYPADWKKYGKAAGPLRNKQMLDEGKPDLVIAFPKNGNIDATKGTKDMVDQAYLRNIPVIIIEA